MSVDEILSAAAARRVEKYGLESPEVDRPQNIPEIVRLPSPGEITTEMSSDELAAIVARYGVLDLQALLDVEAAAALKLGGASRDRLIAALTEIEGSRLGLTHLARAATRHYDTMLAVCDPTTGEVMVEQILVRISEGDDGVCPACIDLAGLEGTIAEHESAGLPGLDSCLGGDGCRCQLVAVD